MNPSSIAKFLTAVAGAIGEAISAGLVHGQLLHWLTIAIAIATAAAVYLVPNTAPAVAPVAPTPPPPPAA